MDWQGSTNRLHEQKAIALVQRGIVYAVELFLRRQREIGNQALLAGSIEVILRIESGSFGSLDPW